MNDNKSILVLSTLLVLVFVGIGFILSYQYGPVNDLVIMEERESEYVQNIVVMGEREESSKMVIAHEKYVGQLDDNGVIITMSNGQATNVRSGIVLVNDMVIKADEHEYSVYRINDPEKSVSTN